MNARYVIGTGWWCPGEIIQDRIRQYGDEAIRSRDFHQLWYQAISRYSNPQKILIVDSNSPLLPDINPDDDRMELVSLNYNAGHNTALNTKFCGAVRAMQLGLMYALQCDTDYFVYLEQDVLIYGAGIIEHCIRCMKTQYMFGSGAGTPQRTQQSLFIIRQDGILSFIKRLNEIKQDDHEIPPEEKYHLVCTRGFLGYLVYLSMKREKNLLINKLDWHVSKVFRNYDHLPIGYGRTRPIRFNDEYFYFQHGTEEELRQYKLLTGL